MNWFNYILPLLIFDSFLLCVAWFFPPLQIPVWLFISTQLLALLILSCFSLKFSDEDQVYFGFLIFGFVLALGMGVV